MDDDRWDWTCGEDNGVGIQSYWYDSELGPSDDSPFQTPPRECDLHALLQDHLCNAGGFHECNGKLTNDKSLPDKVEDISRNNSFVGGQSSIFF